MLNALGISPASIANALKDVFNAAASTVASILNGLGDAASTIADPLGSVFSTSPDDIGNLLSSIGFSNSTIDAIGGAFSSFGQSVADCFSSFVSDC